MNGGQELLLRIITDNGGRRSFPKSSDRLMLAILAAAVKRGQIVLLEETDDTLVYALPESQEAQMTG